MSGRFAERELSETVTLHVPGGPGSGVTGTLAGVRAKAHKGGGVGVGGRREFSLVLEVPLETFQRIDDEDLLGYVDGSMQPGTFYRLMNTRAVELHLGLDRSVAEPLAHLPLEAALDALIEALTSEAPSPLSAASSYRWLAVYQEAPSKHPAVTVKRGFKSIYAP